MKKQLTILLCVVLVFSMAACGSDPAAPTTAPAETTVPFETTIPEAITETVPTPAPTETTEPSAETTAAPTETTAPVPTEPPVTEPAMENSPAHQRLMGLYNGDLIDPAALEAFARWIDAQPGFMEQYPEGWILDAVGGIPSLTCFSPRTENSRRYGFYMHFDGTLQVCDEPYEIFAMDISREEVARMVYDADDPIGVPDELKEGFIDFLLFHDMYPASLFWPQYTTEWYFDWKTYTSNDSPVEYITLYIKVWDSDAEADEYDLCSVFFNGTYIMEGYI